jgi:hypothetical protein
VQTIPADKKVADVGKLVWDPHILASLDVDASLLNGLVVSILPHRKEQGVILGAQKDNDRSLCKVKLQSGKEITILSTNLESVPPNKGKQSTSILITCTRGLGEDIVWR